MITKCTYHGKDFYVNYVQFTVYFVLLLKSLRIKKYHIQPVIWIEYLFIPGIGCSFQEETASVVPIVDTLIVNHDTQNFECDHIISYPLELLIVPSTF